MLSSPNPNDRTRFHDAHVRIYICAYINVCTNACMRACINVRVCVRARVCVHFMVTEITFSGLYSYANGIFSYIHGLYTQRDMDHCDDKNDTFVRPQLRLLYY